MAKILLRQSSTIISNYELGDCYKLETNFSIYNKLYHSYFFKGIEYNEEKKQLIVPRGVDVKYLETMFNTNAMVDRRHDPYDTVAPIMMKFPPRDDVQKRAISFMNGIKDYSYTAGKSQLCVNLNTGKGKTYCSIYTSAMQRMRSIIIASSTTWLDQWRRNILEYTDTKPDEIYSIIGGGSISRILERDMSKYKFIVCSHATLQAYASKCGWEAVSELFKHLKVGLKFYDEAHLSFDNMCKIDFYTNTYKTYYVTATPARSDDEENIIYRYYFKNVPSIDLFDEEEDPHTNYIAMKYNSRPTAEDISKCKTQMGFSANNYSNYVLKSRNFYKMLKVIVDLCITNSGKNIIYIATVEAIEHVYEWIVNEFPHIANNVGRFHSKMPSNIKQDQLNKKIILSTTKSLGPAIDIKGLKMVVVLAEPFKSKVIARQTLGRTRDDNTLYIEVIDTGFKSISKYCTDKKSTYEKYAKSYNTISLTDNDLDVRCTEIDQRYRSYIYPVTFMQFVVPVAFTDGMISPVKFA